MGTRDIDFWLRAVDALAAVFQENEARLCRLDAAFGDGDHGTSMLLGFHEAQKSLRENPAGDAGELLRRTGAAFLDNVGGVTGVVFGSLFDAIGQSASEATAPLDAGDAGALHRVFAAGLAAVKTRGKASEGDKSMLDALSPAVEALRSSAAEGEAAGAALARAAAAAAAGRDATVLMEGKVGRARYQQGKGKGHADAGAASVCLIFETLARMI